VSFDRLDYPATNFGMGKMATDEEVVLYMAL
jgi:hypothetical protein